MRTLITVIALACLQGCAVESTPPPPSQVPPVATIDPACPTGLQCAHGYAWTPQDGATVTLEPGCVPEGQAWASNTVPGEPSDWYYLGVGAYRWCLRSGYQFTCRDPIGGAYTCTAIARSLHRTKGS